MQKALSNLVSDSMASVNFTYLVNLNIITIYSARIPRREFAIKSPTLGAFVLGILLGLICSGLPENVVRFLTDDLFNPMFSVIIGMMAGFVGPVIFLSLLVSISSLGSIRKLTDLGGTIFKRFVFSILFGITVSIFVSLLRGWEFLTAIYLSLGLCCALKLVKVSMKTNIGIPYAPGEICGNLFGLYDSGQQLLHRCEHALHFPGADRSRLCPE